MWEKVNPPIEGITNVLERKRPQQTFVSLECIGTGGPM